LITALRQSIEVGKDASMAELQIEPAQALANLKRLGELIQSHQPNQHAELQALYQR
jgi:hypothetical protein